MRNARTRGHSRTAHRAATMEMNPSAITGTRHRAAVGITENTDAVVLVVSEETGIVSMAKDGELKRPLTVKDLEEILGKIFEERKSGILGLVKILKKEPEDQKNE